MTLEAGAQLGPYEILSPLGAGGMGEVYRARDTRLKRDVAIKVVPEHLAKDPQALNRFEREAQAVAAISHPNILAVYDVGTEEGTSFVVTELLEGETLRESVRRSAIPWRKAVEYGVAIADGLAAAHARGVIHRDLKPENIFLTTDGVVKILDFGLARIETATPAAQQADTPTMTLDTRPGTVLGTVSYMSPEQVRGLKTDARSDIFSFGCVLYEMLTRQRAFTGATPADTMTAILKEEAPDFESTRTEVAPEVERIIARCLEKKSEQRIQSARDLGFALRDILSDSGGARPVVTAGPSQTRRFLWIMAVIGVVAVGTLLAVLSADRWTTRRRDADDEGRRYTSRQTSPGVVESLAVLPLENLSGDPQQEYFADAMTDAIIDDLAKISALRVISRTSVMRYKGTDKSLPEIARELNVDAIVEGTALLAGDRVRIRVRLREATTERQVWGDLYERDIRDILAIQSDVARAIAQGIQIKLTPAEEALLASAPQVNPGAYDAYMTGLGFLHRGTKEACRTALRFFEQALEIDPDFALAHAGRAYTYDRLSDFHMAPKDTMPFAKSAAMDALALDDTLAEAHAALGRVRLRYEWNWSAAEAAFERALELNSSLTDARLGYAEYLTTMKRGDEAMDQLNMVRELDPASLYTHESYGLVSYMARRFDRTIRDCTAALEVDPEFYAAHMWLGMAQGQTGQFASGIRHLRTAYKLNSSALIAATLGNVLAVAGKRTEAKEILEELKEREEQDYVCPYELATISIGLGDHDEAFAEMDRACDGRAGCMPWLQVDPRLDPIRPDPRFDHLLRRVGFEPETRLLAPVEPRREKTMLAVLPFEDISSDPQEWFSDGMTEEMIAQLGRLQPEKLGVIARTSAMKYKNTDKTVAQISRELGVDYILEGSVRRSGRQVRITAQLIQVSDQTHLWSQSYSRDLADILAIQIEVAERIADSLTVELLPGYRKTLARGQTADPAAYQAYLKGRHWWNRRTPEGFRRATDYFNEAVALDPEYGLAFAGLADVHLLLPFYGIAPPSAGYPRAKQAALRALEIDDTLAEAHTSLGGVMMNAEWDPVAAGREFKQAIRLNPNYAAAHYWYASCFLTLGRFEEARRQAEKALELDPLAPIVHHALVWCFYNERKYDDVIRYALEALEFAPDYPWIQTILGGAYAEKGMFAEAIARHEEAVRLSNGGALARAALGHTYAMAGQRKEAIQVVEELQRRSDTDYVVPSFIAVVYAGLGDKDRAFEWLEKAYRERTGWMLLLNVDPRLDGLRDDPRFDDLLRRIGLEPSSVPVEQTP